MNGISNKLAADVEISQNEAAIENYAKRTIETGSYPGTHTLGSEFRTKSRAATEEFDGSGNPVGFEG